MKQQLIQIQPEDLLDRVERMKDDGCRMVQICCTRVPEGYELTYSFDRDYCLYNLRFTVPESAEVPSITGIFWPAFIYENEIHDLFGLSIRHIERDVDYGGKFYRLAEKTPWRKVPPQHAAPKRHAPKAAPAIPKKAPEAAAQSQPEGEKQNG